ncbi:3TM-type holin [Desulfobacula sp.]|uniref:3TM-type holin n=1 Tax=Desulfobacula sp. TaxID=2593537 RepID=UPI0026255525|nr:3TM-type holin [Desulfobacula sp.]
MAGLLNIDLGNVIKTGGNLLDDLFTSDEERGELALQEKAMANDLVKGQMEVNKAEAGHKSIFVAGWRPAVGWIGAVSLAYQFILYPLLLWFWSFGQAKKWIPITLNPPPMLDTGALLMVVTGMLGIGGMRSFDKVKGVNTDMIKK